MPFLAKTTLSVKSSYRWDHHTVKGSEKNYSREKNQVGLEFVTIANGMHTTTTDGEPTML
jgi:hypothetical protein